MIAGKWHEQGQVFEGGRKISFNDVTVARDMPPEAGSRRRRPLTSDRASSVRSVRGSRDGFRWHHSPDELRFGVLTSLGKPMPQWGARLVVVGAVTAAVVIGCGPALALSGSSGHGSASVAQYKPAGSGRGITLGASGHGGPSGAGGSPGSSGGGTGGTGGAGGSGSASGLPFTGYALLIAGGIGLCLLSVGLMVRRRTGPTLP